MTGADVSGLPAAPPAASSVGRLRVLCIGNGGVTYRGRLPWTHRSVAMFLAEMGERVREICFCAWLDPSDDQLAQTGLEGIRGVRAVALPRFDGAVVRKLLNGIWALAILIREVAWADFVYLYWPGRLSSITARLCRAFRKPYGIYFRGEQIALDPTFATAFREARFTLAAGKALETTARAYCRDVEMVTPMVSLGPEHLVAPRSSHESRPWNLLYIGRLEQRKGVHDLLVALRYLEEWGVPCTLTLVGQCYDDALTSLLPGPVSERVRFVGAVAEFEELERIYRAADVFVLPSHDEGFPRVLYEAMTFGVPIVTTFVGSISSVMKDEVNCLRIDVRNPQDIAEKIRHLLTNSELQTRIAWGGHDCMIALMDTWRRSHALQVAERLSHLAMRS